MSIDFSTLQGLTIPEGAVTQIADAAGNVLWALSGGKVILEVEKITSDTYAGETTYIGEQFILLDIYPKTNGTVNVTYGGLTKTITDTSGVEEPNAQQVFFGTFNGVSDSVAAPASGELTIEGDYYAFACGMFATTSKSTGNKLFVGVTKIVDFGEPTKIPAGAFGSSLGGSCTKITTVKIPNTVTVIEYGAFLSCGGLTSVTIPNGVTSIGTNAFGYCTGLADIKLPSTLKTIGGGAFSDAPLTQIVIPSGVTSIAFNPFAGCSRTNIISVENGNTAYKMDGNCLVEIATKKVVAGFTDSTIPSYVTWIGNQAFYDLDNLVSVTIPASVTDMETICFGACPALTTVTILATTPPTAHISSASNFFTLSDALTTITVPKGCGEAYKAADGWSAYADKIVEAS